MSATPRRLNVSINEARPATLRVHLSSLAISTAPTWRPRTAPNDPLPPWPVKRLRGGARVHYHVDQLVIVQRGERFQLDPLRFDAEAGVCLLLGADPDVADCLAAGVGGIAAAHAWKTLIHALAVGAELERLAGLGCDVAIIDTPPRWAGADTAARQAARLADLLVVPLRPTIVDLEATVATIERLRSVTAALVVAVLNGCAARGRDADEAAEALTDRGVEVCPARIGQRVVPAAAEIVRVHAALSVHRERTKGDTMSKFTDTLKVPAAPSRAVPATRQGSEACRGLRPAGRSASAPRAGRRGEHQHADSHRGSYRDAVSVTRVEALDIQGVRGLSAAPFVFTQRCAPVVSLPPLPTNPSPPSSRATGAKRSSTLPSRLETATGSVCIRPGVRMFYNARSKVLP